MLCVLLAFVAVLLSEQTYLYYQVGDPKIIRVEKTHMCVAFPLQRRDGCLDVSALVSDHPYRIARCCNGGRGRSDGICRE